MFVAKRFRHIDKDFYRLYKLSFPKEERLSLLLLLILIGKKADYLYQYYEEDKFIGFTFSVTFGKCSSLILFATNPDYRNKGYGKQILQEYLKNNSNNNVFLNCELPDLKSNDDIKYRRLNFYLRNGLKFAPLIMTYKNVSYLTLTNKKFSEDEINDIVKVYKQYKCSYRLDNDIINNF